jgi:signal transduction histidine kinase/CheY-like chemotaxis protein
VQVIEQLEHGDGVVHYSLVSKFPIPAVDGTKPLVGGMAIDITERQRAEQALEEADRRKDEFLATLAHELRNPLAPIRNSLEIFKRAGDDRELLEQVRETIERQIAHMVRLVDDLIDVSRITRGTLELRRERLSLNEVLRQAAEACAPLREREKQTVELGLAESPLYVLADSVRLTQVFSNLLHNASKYTPSGGSIRIAAERIDGEAQVSVTDSGIGIPADQLEKIFEMFWQVDKSLEQSRGGLGIGLTLVKRLVELHDGTVRAHSAGLGHGSQFVVRLPLVDAPQADEAPATLPTEAAAPLKILIADDNQDSARTLAILLRHAGHRIELAHDGAQAVAAAAEFQPDVALLDIGMPKLNGFDVCRRIRSEPWGKFMRIAALTGWGQEEDRRKSKEAGFDYHLVKPVEHAALLAILHEMPGQALT